MVDAAPRAPVRLYALAGPAFLSAVTDHSGTYRSATEVAEAYPDGAGREA